ncbi:MAG: hypothetical protein N2C14_12490 [Planctomycetales bacterium]
MPAAGLDESPTTVAKEGAVEHAAIHARPMNDHQAFLRVFVNGALNQGRGTSRE